MHAPYKTYVTPPLLITFPRDPESGNKRRERSGPTRYSTTTGFLYIAYSRQFNTELCREISNTVTIFSPSALRQFVHVKIEFWSSYRHSYANSYSVSVPEIRKFVFQRSIVLSLQKRHSILSQSCIVTLEFQAFNYYYKLIFALKPFSSFDHAYLQRQDRCCPHFGGPKQLYLL